MTALHFTALGGGLAWADAVLPHASPLWWRGLSRFSWPFCLSLFVLLLCIEWRATLRLSRLLGDGRGGGGPCQLERSPF